MSTNPTDKPSGGLLPGTLAPIRSTRPTDAARKIWPRLVPTTTGHGFGVAVGASAIAAALALLLYGSGRVNNDTMWSIAWGRQILDGDLPDFDVGPTPHPLANALGVVVAPLDAAAESTVLALGFLSAGLLIGGVCVVAHRAFGFRTASAAGLLVITLPVMLTTTTGAYVDVPYAALVVLAVALELKRPRRGAATLGILAIAGLLRPEAWLLGGAYWLWLAPTLHGRRSWAVQTALAGAAPAVWMGTDLLTTGNPLFGLTHTTEATALTGRQTGASAIADLPVFTTHVVGGLICVAALVGFAGAIRSPRGQLVFGWLVAVTAAGGVPVLVGTPLNERYFLATFALLCVFAAYGAFGWIGQAPRLAQALGIACVILLIVQAALNVGELTDRRHVQAEAFARRDAAKTILSTGTIPCRPLIVPAQRVRMLAAVWTQTPLSEVGDAHEYQSRGVYLTGTDVAMRDVVTLSGRAGTAARPPSGTKIVRASGGWQLLQRC